MDAIVDYSALHSAASLRLDRDRVLSPLTGWTRESYLDLLDAQLAAYARSIGPQGQAMTPPTPAGWPVKTSDRMEGAARSFLGAAARICADPSDPTGLIPRYRTLLVTGCDPDSPHCWSRPAPGSQVIVEAAAIALGLTWTKPWLFDTMTAPERRLVIDYLAAVSGQAVPDNNWHLFTVVVDEFCQQNTPTSSHAYRTREAEITDKLDRIDQWYTGEGWYTDGPGRSFDHYCGWAMHLYSTMWARAALDRRPDARERLDIYRQRLATFLEHYAPTFADDGAPLHFGRSLIYRHATVAPLWLAQLVDAGGPPPGITRAMASRTVSYFVDHGAFDAAGLPNLGWHHTFLPMVQKYSGAGSPLWSTKGFLGLLLPADHPVWTQTEQPPQWQGRTGTFPTGIQGVLATRSATGLVRIANHGSTHRSDNNALSNPDYSRIGYSTHTGPLYRVQPDPVTNRADGLDQGLSLARDGIDSHRTQFWPLQVTSNRPCAASWHRPLWAGETEGPVVVSASAFAGGEELRVHLILGARSGDVATDAGAAICLAKPGAIAGPPTESEPPGAHGPAARVIAARVSAGNLSTWSRGILGWQRATRLLGCTAYDPQPAGIGEAPTAAACALRATLRAEPQLLVAAHGLTKDDAHPPIPQLSARIEWHSQRVRLVLDGLDDEPGSWTLDLPLDLPLEPTNAQPPHGGAR